MKTWLEPVLLVLLVEMRRVEGGGTVASCAVHEISLWNSDKRLEGMLVGTLRCYRGGIICRDWNSSIATWQSATHYVPVVSINVRGSFLLLVWLLLLLLLMVVPVGILLVLALLIGILLLIWLLLMLLIRVLLLGMIL
jgi:hypothetical protein